MPPFSPDIDNQAQHYCNGSGSNASEERTLLRREGVSDLVYKLPGAEMQHHFYPHHWSKHNFEAEEKDSESDLYPVRGGYEAAKLVDLDSVLEDFEDNYNIGYGRKNHHNGDNYYLHSHASFSSARNNNESNKGIFAIPKRRVSFAGKVFGETVLDDLKVKLIPHVQEYTSNEKRSMWYTKKELKAMRKSCLHAALIVSQDAELYCPYFLRGLEHLVEEYIHYNTTMPRCPTEDASFSNNDCENESSVNESLNDCHCRDSSSTAGSRRWDAVEAVLYEQDQQRRMFWDSYGIVYGGMVDAEKIRSVYAIEGKTNMSQSIARANAKRDEACAKEWLSEATHAINKADTVNSRQETTYYDDEDVDHCHEITSSSGELAKNVGFFLQKLLTPFLDIRDGDIYIQMGDEFFLAYA